MKNFRPRRRKSKRAAPAKRLKASDAGDAFQKLRRRRRAPGTQELAVVVRMPSHAGNPRRIGSRPCSASKTSESHLETLPQSVFCKNHMLEPFSALLSETSAVRGIPCRRPGPGPARRRRGTGDVWVGTAWLVVILDMANRRRQVGSVRTEGGENFPVPVARWSRGEPTLTKRRRRQVRP